MHGFICLRRWTDDSERNKRWRCGVTQISSQLLLSLERVARNFKGITMIRVIGGNQARNGLGMFIGFSFSNSIMHLNDIRCAARAFIHIQVI
jgi:hypothetical protein